jgi:hypothetical protein
VNSAVGPEPGTEAEAPINTYDGPCTDSGREGTGFAGAGVDAR